MTKHDCTDCKHVNYLADLKWPGLRKSMELDSVKHEVLIPVLKEGGFIALSEKTPLPMEPMPVLVFKLFNQQDRYRLTYQFNGIRM